MAHRLTSLILASVVAAPAMAQTLTVIEPPVTFQRSFLTGVSGDGQVAFGYYQREFPGDTPLGFRWTREGGLVTMSSGDGYVSSFVTSASNDGAVFAGYAYRQPFPFVEAPSSHAALWTSSGPTAPTPLATLETGPNRWSPGRGGWFVSGDGNVIVGISSCVWNAGTSVYSYFRWMGATGIEPIVVPGPMTSISHDGTTIIGNRTASGSVYRWTAATGAVDIVPSRTATAANASGTVIAGRGGFRWTETDRVTLLGPPQGVSHPLVTEPHGLSEDGSVIVGSLCHQGDPVRAFLWTDRLGLWDLNSLLPRMGVTGSPQLRACTGISNDGRIIVGVGTVGNIEKGFVLTVPQCSSADFNNDGNAGTDADIDAFFACLAGDCCSTCWWLGADVNSDGDTGTDSDIESFFRVMAGESC